MRARFRCACSLACIPTTVALGVIILDICFTVALTICPTPMPCYCVSDQIVYCAFMRLQKLPYFLDFKRSWKELDISENFLRELVSGGFDGVRVRTIKLNNNNVRTIQAHAFRNVIGVRTLDLSHNYLNAIDRDGFLHLKDLRLLKLNYNQLVNLDHNSFKEISHVHELDLTGNELRRVPWSALRPMSGLKRLILRHNALQAIDKYSFYNLPLEFLDLGDNGRPLVIHQEAFCGLEPRVLQSAPGITDWSGLHTLLLDHNGLNGLSPCIARQIWTLATVNIAGNPLLCDCELWVLRDIGPRTELPGAQCDTPDDFAGEYVTDVAQGRYTCSVNDTLRSCSNLCQSSPPSINAASRVTTDASRSQPHAILVWSIVIPILSAVVT